MRDENSVLVRIVISREQDGEFEKDEYTGRIKEINNRLIVTFAGTQDDGNIVSHLLKIDSDGMEWVRAGDSGKNKTAFRAGSSLPFLYSTPHGDIMLKIVTQTFSYIKKDTHLICVSYTVNDGDKVLSEYNTDIEIITL